MLARKQVREGPSPEQVPADIYISLVDALFRDSRSLFIGSIAASLTTLICAYTTQEMPLYVCAVAMVAVAIARAIDMRRFQRQRASVTTAEAASRWEIRYVIGAATFVALLGVSCLIAFYETQDPFVQLISFSIALAYLIGVSGRNFASQNLVMAQILCGGIPMALAMASAGGLYYAVILFVLVPLFVSMKFISDRLRRTLLDAAVATRDVTFLATRFDTALNNMPHGLCMFDAERRLVVANSRLPKILGLPSSAVTRGVSMRQLMLECIRAGTILSSEARNLSEEFDRHFTGKATGDLELQIPDGRTLALTFQPMGTGGSVVLVEDITERRNAEARIHHLARFDALTGLPNRTLFREHMDRAISLARRQDQCAILFIDLDQFKQVNDTLGHPSGDALLCAVADRLRLIIRETDSVARFGGDEFVILQSPMKRPEEAATLAQRIVRELSEPYDIDGHEAVVGASIGISIAPNDGIDADLLLKNADMALYRAKSDGRGAWRFFEPEMDVRAQARRTMELDLRNALVNDELVPYYQPLMNLRTGRISTCEALLRWPHPERGMIPPSEFIPVAEEMGLIVEIGQRVLKSACAECMKWPADVRVSVNLSPIQFRRGNLVSCIKEALAASGLPANRLEVEITESVLLQDTDVTRVVLAQLREMGIRISLDDFGTGYSSLSYLHSFSLNKVKIDRSFLADIGTSERSLTLLRGVARLSTELGMSVVIEGVETEEQLALITKETSAAEAQGYLFSPPIQGHLLRDLLYATSPKFGKKGSMSPNIGRLRTR
jgi:diguanylate cyclase (GGDEF)-like protein